MWKIYKELIGKVADKTTIPDMFIVKGEQITDHKLISEGFTTYFSTIGKSMALRIPNGQREYEDYLHQGLGTGIFYISPTDPAEVLTIINSLKPKRICGSDRISMHLLKQVGTEISDIISKAINKSISSASVPFCQKAAKIIPIYKAGDELFQLSPNIDFAFNFESIGNGYAQKDFTTICSQIITYINVNTDLEKRTRLTKLS